MRQSMAEITETCDGLCLPQTGLNGTGRWGINTIVETITAPDVLIVLTRQARLARHRRNEKIYLGCQGFWGKVERMRSDFQDSKLGF